MSAIAAVDMALWDIKGKWQPAGLSTARWRFTRTVMVYSHATGRDIQETLDACAK
jgi:mannonate dehydratase